MKRSQVMPEQPAASNPPQMLNEADTARYVGMSRIWLRQSRQRGTGPEYIRIGRTIRYAVSDLDRFITTHRVRRYEARAWKA
jgi:predicted DNA-binding transcriptional regulator AlpA